MAGERRRGHSGSETISNADKRAVRRTTEAELARREAQLREAQSIAKLGSWELDLDAGSFEWSDEAYRIFGWDPGEVTPTFDLFLGLMSEEDARRVRDAVEHVAHGGDEFELEIQATRSDGSLGFFSVRGRPGGSLDERPVVTGTALDITERKRLEEQLLQSQKMEALGGLAGGIAHDFNNLLAVILNYGRFIAADLPPHHPLGDDVKEMVGAAERGATLVRQLLSFARREVVRPEPINLNLLVAQMSPLLKRAIAEDIVLETRLADALWSTDADRGQIEQLLLNLVVNARDAMPDGGRISIETRNVTADETFVSSRPQMSLGRYVALVVSDTGTGMDKQTQAHAFEPFFTTKPRGSGTGLGLSSVYGIVQRVGGDISLYSEPGLGTTFKIYLPASELSVEVGGSPAARPRYRDGNGERILIVEDEESVLELIERILRGAGYAPIAVSTPQEALQHVHSREDIELLLTDVILPEMSGRRLAQIAALPTVFMSGYTDSVIAQQGVIQEGVVFLPKPFSATELLSVVRTTLDQRLHIDLTGAR